ncbi:MAG: hypothetical protein ACRCV5_23705 [Afipia sp.]
MITTFAVSTLTALTIVLLAIIWNQHDRIRWLRIQMEEADSWAQFFEDAEKLTRHELRTVREERDALQRSHDNVHALYCALVRRRLQETSHLVGRNLHPN